MHNSY